MQFRILGPLEVVVQSEPVAIRGAKQRALLGLLLLRANEVISRDALIDGLWGERPPRSAGHSLEAHISRLRKLLENGQDLVQTTPGGYVLNLRDGDVDLEEFERLADDGRQALRAGDEERATRLLRRAIVLWRGTVLEDVPLDSFAVAEIRSIEDRRLAAYEDLMEAELETGHQADVLPELERLVRLNPLRERLHAQLMLALYRCGRQAEALEAFRNARRHLADELGIEPGPELRDLEQAILRQDDGLAPAASRARDPAQVRQRRRRRIAAGALTASAALAAGLALVLTRGGTSRAPARVSANVIGVLSSRTGRLAEQVPEGATPDHLAIGEGGVWVTNAAANTVSRIDPAKWVRVQTINVGSSPSGIATGEDAVWVANNLDGTVSWINPVTNAVVQTTPVGNGPEGVAFGANSVWVANTADGTIARLDALNGKVTERIDSPANELAYGGNALWATDSSGDSVSRINPVTNTVAETIHVGRGPAGVAFGFNSAWVANELDGTVSRIDASTNGIDATIPVGGDPNGIAAGAGAIWVSNASGRTLTRIDPENNRVDHQVEIGSPTSGVAVDNVNSRVLIGIGPSGAGHRGGTLRLRTNFIGSIDTAVAYGVNEWSVLNLTGDGLTGFKRIGGTEGAQLVPDLAVSIPTPTNFGRTYSFRVRRNIRYSSGVRLEASDIRYALERDFRLGAAAPAGVYGRIVGASACVKVPRRCDLSKGVVADDASGTVTFHLSAPDPEFLYKLALPFAYAVPAGTPMRDVGTHPQPATGPYVVASYRPRHLLTLHRNVHFHEWSRAAQPKGYPDQIVLRIGGTADGALEAIEGGNADVFDSWGPGALSSGRLRQLRTRFAGQLHVNPRPVTVGFFLNTHLPPFDDVRARRALNYAADRALAVTRLGGPDAGRPTCQILPPDFPGYEHYCPYATDLARAQRLTAASTRSGTRVTVWFSPWAQPWLKDLGPYVAKLLDSLGYRASVAVERPSTDIRREQAGFVAWAADYPGAWDFLTPLSCGSWSQFCDPSLDRQQGAALNAESTSPQAANLLWAGIDRRIVNEAAWLPLVTPKWIDFLSKRVGNYQYNPEWGMLLDQLWVR